MIVLDLNFEPPFYAFQRQIILEKIDKNKIEEIVEKYKNEIKITLSALGIYSFLPQNKNIANYIKLSSKTYAHYQKGWEKITFYPFIDVDQIRTFIKSTWDVRALSNQRLWYVIDYEIGTESHPQYGETVYIDIFIKYKIQKR